MPAFDSQTTGVNYSAACTIEGVWQGNGGFYTVAGADAYAQLQWGIQGGGEWTQEVHVPVGNGTMFPGTSGIRFRTYTTGSPATVSASIAPPRQPTLNIGSPGVVTPTMGQVDGITGSVSAAGAIVLGSGFTVTKGAVGIYTLNFTTAFAAAPILLLTLTSTAGLIAYASPVPNTASAGVIIRDSGFNNVDCAFDFLALAVQ